MGLGKTIQAIGTAIQKKELFGFKKMLIVCPASLKTQWKSEIEKFTNESVAIVEGSAIQREQLYKTVITSYSIHYTKLYERLFSLLDEVTFSSLFLPTSLLSKAEMNSRYLLFEAFRLSVRKARL